MIGHSAGGQFVNRYVCAADLVKAHGIRVQFVVKNPFTYLYFEKIHREFSSNLDKLWKHCYESICDYENHLRRNGTKIVKFFVHLSRDEQRKRFLPRIDEPDKIGSSPKHTLRNPPTTKKHASDLRIDLFKDVVELLGKFRIVISHYDYGLHVEIFCLHEEIASLLGCPISIENFVGLRPPFCVFGAETLELSGAWTVRLMPEK